MFINRRRKEINLKIVYYGPALSGKTTSLQWIFRRTPAKYRSNLMSIKTKEDRTLFFDFLQVQTGKVMGLTPKFKLYTVPGQIYYQASRRLILQGVDGVVFVADSDPKRLRANIESWQHLNQHLRSYRVDMRHFPVIVQANKRDLSEAVSLPLLVKVLNAGGYPLVESVATRGTGVTDALKLVIQAVLRTVTKRR